MNILSITERVSKYATAMSPKAQELHLYLTGNTDLYKRRWLPLISNLRKKIDAGSYDHEKAFRIAVMLVDEAADQYTNEFGGTVSAIFPRLVRNEVANVLIGDFEVRNLV